MGGEIHTVGASLPNLHGNCVLYPFAELVKCVVMEVFFFLRTALFLSSSFQEFLLKSRIIDRNSLWPGSESSRQIWGGSAHAHSDTGVWIRIR